MAIIETALVFGMGWLLGQQGGGKKKGGGGNGPLPASPTKAKWPADHEVQAGKYGPMTEQEQAQVRETRRMTPDEQAATQSALERGGLLPKT